MSYNIDTNENQVQITLTTKQEINAVPSTPFSIPAAITVFGLNDLINQLLDETSNTSKTKNFDFLIGQELLRTSLKEHLDSHGISSESTVEIEYIERTPAPEPEDAILHDDWVSTVRAADKYILSGSYDNSVNIWTTHGKMIVSSKMHTDIIKQVAWLTEGDPTKGFISVSHDLVAYVWDWKPETNQLERIYVLKGHERGIDCVAVNSNSLKVVTGGWDTNLKIWPLQHDDSEPPTKKSKGSPSLITALHTLKGHKENISSSAWIDNYTICSASMDHTIKFWDAATCGITNEIVGSKAFLAISWSPLSNCILACSADNHIRLYDPRSCEGSVCKTTFTSHVLWANCVAWSKYDQHLFLSGGYDAQVKLWDNRSPKAPLYNLQGHNGQVLAVDWSNNKYLISGGTDNSLHLFKNQLL